jgi:hypothetical protein
MGMSPKVAGQLGLKKLYHYQDFDLKSSDDRDQSPDHVARITDVLKSQRIWCSDPTTFNDPWDCKPYFDPAFLDDPDTRAATAEALISTRGGGPELNDVDEQMRTDPDLLKATMHGLSQELVSFIASRWGIYCLSPDPDLALMWSHYARNHNGICLEFAVPNTKFQLALQIQYQKEYPKNLLHDMLRDPGSRSTLLLVKSDDWSYEREFRLVCFRSPDVAGSPLSMDGNYLGIGPADLTSIILGCQVEDRADAEIRKLVKDHAPNVRVRKAKRALNEYRLVIED